MSIPTTAPLPRNEIMERLQERGIATRPGTHAVHMLGYYRKRVRPRRPTISRPPAIATASTMAIPLHNRMSEDDYEYVVESLRGNWIDYT